MALLLDEPEIAATYQTILKQGKKSFDTKLWNGQYYNYDASNNDHHNSIMADQMAGQWYARACGLNPIVPDANAYIAMQTVYQMNVKGFKVVSYHFFIDIFRMVQWVL
jgi:non-lysosomal glucosylceramidase